MIKVSQSMLEYSLSCWLDKDTGSSTTSSYLNNLAATLASKKYLKDNDTDKDGGLNKDEVTLSEEAFKKLDEDKDDLLSEEEIRASLSGYEGEIYDYLAKTDPRWSKIKELSSMVMKI
ncbi:hypothetical protein [Megalodesulfovibrio paquesii]